MRFALPVLLAPLVAAAAPPGSQAVIDSAPASAWRPLDQANTLYMQVNGGTVVIELAPALAPRHVSNIKALVAARAFDASAVTRVQDNYVAQWGLPEGRAIGSAARTLPLEAERPAAGLTIAPLPYRDSYAPETGFADGFAVARGGGRVWGAHCYASVGVGRDSAPDSGSGSELFAVIGHAPRHLDRNYVVVGRVVSGIERLSVLPRGTEALGFYRTPAEHVPIARVRLGTELPATERLEVEMMRTDAPSFASYVAARADRSRDGFLVGAGGVDVCNIRVPQRPARP